MLYYIWSKLEQHFAMFYSTSGSTGRNSTSLTSSLAGESIIFIRGSHFLPMYLAEVLGIIFYG